MKSYSKLFFDNGGFEYTSLEVSLAHKLHYVAKSVTDDSQSKIALVLLLRSLYPKGMIKQECLRLLSRAEVPLVVDDRWFTEKGFSLALDSCKDLTGFSKDFIACSLIQIRLLITGLVKDKIPKEANFFEGKWLTSEPFSYINNLMSYFPEPVTGANALSEHGYASYSSFNHEVHCSYGLPTKTFLCSRGYSLTNGRPLRDDEVTMVEGSKIVSPFWALYDLFYSQSDDTAITEALEFFQEEGILDDFISFCKEEGMHQEVLDYNLNMFLYGQSGLPLPSVMEYKIKTDILGFL